MIKPRGTTWRSKSGGMLTRFLQTKLSQIPMPRNLALATPITLLPQPIVKFVYNTLELQISVSLLSKFNESFIIKPFGHLEDFIKGILKMVLQYEP
jgi:hypothetical protein